MDNTIVNLSPMLGEENIQCIKPFQLISRPVTVIGLPRLRVLSIAGRELRNGVI